MSHMLLISVRLHEGRYHGVGDNPPSPARLFQALIAAAGIGGPLRDKEKRALRWLEELDPPLIASPIMKPGQQFKNYMPNNDLDAKGGDRRRIGGIRVDKDIWPLLFDAEVPFLYAWTFEASEARAVLCCRDSRPRRAAVPVRARVGHSLGMGRGVD